MNILVDKHHESLFQSLILLFEKRLHWTLYTQAGMDWYHQKLWEVYPHPSTAEQYLLREVEKDHGITLEEFKNTKFDVLLCSIPQHVSIWLKLRDLYQPQAKLIMQIGNAWIFNDDFPIKNIMASAKIPYLPRFNYIKYHQEFDLNIFKYGEPQLNKNIYSFINCLNTADLFKKDWQFFQRLEYLMSDWNFKSYGGQCRDGVVNWNNEIADKMRESFFVYHCKSGGDGFGHVIHNAAAVGRPLIIRKSDYKRKLAEPLLIDGETCLIIDDKDPEEIANLLKLIYNNLNIYQEMCQNVLNTFRRNVNFDEEFDDIQIFLANLI